MGIGHKNTLPFVCPEEMKHFRETTCKTEDPQKKNLVIMGKNTWISLNKKPLPKRINVVLSKDSSVGDEMDGIMTRHFTSLTDVLYEYQNDNTIENIFVIGGETLYKEAIQKPNCKRIILSMIDCDPPPECDTFFPKIPDDYSVLYVVRNQTFTLYYYSRT